MNHATQPADLEKPAHILVFLCDQMRPDYLGCYQPGLVRTPAIDALAADGVVFDQARTVCPLCTPARTSLLTGLYPHKHKMVGLSSGSGGSHPFERPTHVAMLDQYLQQLGTHRSAWFGKWHIGSDDAFVEAGGFDQRKVVSHPWAWTAMEPDKLQKFGPYAGVCDMRIADFPDGQVTDWLSAFYQQLPAEQPSIAFASLPGPHDPHMLPSEFGVRHEPDGMPLPSNRHDPLTDKPYHQAKARLKDPLKRMWNTGPDPDAGLRSILACIYSYTELIDHLVGRTITQLKDQGLYERTAIVFTADHGDMAGAHGFFSKGSFAYEETSRIPLIVKPPSSWNIAHRRSSEQVCLTDLTATLVDWLTPTSGGTSGGGSDGAAMGDQPLQGQSITPLLRDGSWDKVWHYEQSHTGPAGFCDIRMVTDGQWKLVYNANDTHEMYDLATDPGEMHNLFYHADHTAQRDRLIDALISEAKRLDDSVGQAFDPRVECLSREEVRTACQRVAGPPTLDFPIAEADA